MSGCIGASILSDALKGERGQCSQPRRFHRLRGLEAHPEDSEIEDTAPVGGRMAFTYRCASAPAAAWVLTGSPKTSIVLVPPRRISWIWPLALSPLYPTVVEPNFC